jgi:hypothetical protein
MVKGGGGEERLTKVDVNSGREERADHFDHVGAIHAQFARQREALGYVLRRQHSARHALLEKTEFRALCDAVRHCEFDHVVARFEGDHVVVDAGPLDFGVVFEVELLGFKVGLDEGAGGDGDAGRGGGEGQVGEDVFFLLLCEVPEDSDAVGEDEHLAELHGVRGYACVFARVAAVRREVVEGFLFVGVHVVAVDKVGFLVAKVAFMVIALLVALNLFVEDRLSARALQRGTTTHAIAIATREKGQVVHRVETVVVELSPSVVLVLDKLGGALHFVGLGGAVCRDARELVRSPGFWQPLRVTLVLGPTLCGPSCESLVGRGPIVLILLEVALFILLLFVCLG